MPQFRLDVVAPELPQFIGQRAESVEWLVLDRDNNVQGGIAPYSQGTTINQDATRDVMRTVDNLVLSEATCSELNMLSSRLMPQWVMDDGSQWPLGVFMFSAADRNRRSDPAASFRSLSMYDMNALLLDNRREPFSMARGASIKDAIDQLLDEVYVTARDIHASGGTGDVLAWPAGTPRMKILRHLCAISQCYRPYFDNRGTCVVRRAENLDDAVPTIEYETGPSSRVISDSIVEAKDLFDAPNVFVVVADGANETEITATAYVPATMPHSAQNRGREIVEIISLQGVASTEAAFAAAAAVHAQRPGDFFTLEFQGAPDPRHDTFDIIVFDGTLYREMTWDLTCTPSGPHGHSLRQAYSLVENLSDTAPSGVGEVNP